MIYAAKLAAQLRYAVLGLILAACCWASPTADTPPEVVLQAYLRSVYARDYPAAYASISLADREVKTRDEYVQENGAFSGAALEMARVLAALIRFEKVKVVTTGNSATITFRAIVPDANAQALQDLFLEFDQERLAALSPGERAARLDQLRQMARSGRLPVIAAENESWELVREDGSWHIFLNWAGAVTIHFEAATRAGLPWEFVPFQPVVRAMPGETLQTFYRVKNLADRQITGKARHILDPPEETGYLEVIFCFCFLQQTLEAGEEQKLPVTFRVNYEIPDTIKEMRVRYEFYPIDKFPDRTNK